MSEWGISCAKCGHPAAYHGMTFCQVDAGGVTKRPCDCDGYAISIVTDLAAHDAELRAEIVAEIRDITNKDLGDYYNPMYHRGLERAARIAEGEA